ncbi:proton-coupled amino acid transporter-like protein pathetic isoform X2 [Ischnura elegans]|uniref:proton-coupled amino acid transporter-like protein pathetic isoform X2 n=1 Tax=Ischnura elegans TaxID=197161 RepID=UPI001ED8A8AA|nr:proton-coupled amino acid transporter-like protein pathetic isoform X2 [Ischnura elegans]
MEESASNGSMEHTEQFHLHSRRRRVRYLKNPYAWYDPFAARGIPGEDLLSDVEVFFVLTLVVSGFNFLEFPRAYSISGISSGLFITIAVTIITIHCNYLWVKCTHEIYYRVKVPQLTYGETITLAFNSENVLLRKFTLVLVFFVNISLLITYFAICSVYLNEASYSIHEIMDLTKYDTKIAISDLIISVVVIAVGFLPNWKKISRVSMLGCFAGIAVYVYFLCHVCLKETQYKVNAKISISTDTTYFSILVIKSLFSIGITQPMENMMEHPYHLIKGFCFTGINSMSLTLVSLINTIFGIVAYDKFGEEACRMLLEEELLVRDWTFHLFHMLKAVAIMGAFPVPFYIAYDMMWRRAHEKFLRCPRQGVIATRVSLTLIILFSFIFTSRAHEKYFIIVVYLCATFIGIIIPAVLEIVIYWQKPSQIPYFQTSATSLHSESELPKDFHKIHKLRMLLKNGLIIILALGAMIAASDGFGGVTLGGKKC